jgi:hypothetical protein
VNTHHKVHSITRRPLTRRELFAVTSASVGAGVALSLLSGCGANAATIDAQALADAQGLVSTTQAIEAALGQYAPNAIPATDEPKIASLEAAAVAALQKLAATTPAPTGASTLQVIDTDINTVLGVIGAALPGAAAAFPPLLPFIPMYDAAVALLPAIETYVNSVISPATPVVASLKAAKAIKLAYTPDQARAIMGIRKVK